MHRVQFLIYPDSAICFAYGTSNAHIELFLPEWPHSAKNAPLMITMKEQLHTQTSFVCLELNLEKKIAYRSTLCTSEGHGALHQNTVQSAHDASQSVHQLLKTRTMQMFP